MYIETNEMKKIAIEQRKNIEALNLKSGENSKKLEELKQQLNGQIDKINSLTNILNDHTETLVKH